MTNRRTASRKSRRSVAGDGQLELLGLTVELEMPLEEMLCASGALTGAHRFIARDLTETLDRKDRSVVKELILLLLLALEEGSLCLRENEIEGLLIRTLPVMQVEADADESQGGEKAAGTSAAHLARYCEQALRSLPVDGTVYGSSHPLFGEAGILVLDHSSDGRSLYFRKHHEALHVIRDAVKNSFLHDAVISTERERHILNEILTERPVCSGGHPLPFTDEQRLALSVGLRRSLFVLSGGPGTGKTTIILSLLRALVRNGAVRIRLAAPTGKAAARMAESVQSGLQSITNPAEEDRLLARLEPVTLHRLLGIRPGLDEPASGPGAPLDVDLLVVDEVSMVDVVMMARLLRAVDLSRTRLVLIGDRDQLPSVEAGAVLADMIRLFEKQGPDRFVLLTRGHRSQSAVRGAARWANSGGDGGSPFTPLSVDKLGGAWEQEASALIEREANADLEILTSTWMGLAFPQRYVEIVRDVSRMPAPQSRRIADPAYTGLLSELFAMLEHSRLLTVLRRGRAGSETLNRVAQLHLARRIGASLRSRTFSGLPILIRRNDSLRGLANGDTGLVIEFRGRRALALFRSEGGFFGYAPDVLPTWEPAFAMTVHKSQGSEYDRVLLVLPEEEDHPLMTRQIIYTAVTRARRLVVVSGRESALVKAVQREWQRIT